VVGGVVEPGVLVVDPLDMLFLAPGKELPEAHAAGHLDELPGVAHGVAGRLEHLGEVLGAALRVAEEPLPLDPHGGREDHVRHVGGGGRIDVRHHDEAAVLLRPVPVAVQVGHGDHGVRHLDPHEADVAAVQGPEHRDRDASARGSMFSTGTPQISAAFRRASGLVTVPQGSRFVSVPTSRTVPQALGWPVREKGLLPGVAIFP
jgi:hypothetical protein